MTEKWIKLDVEFHVIENFAPKVLIGRDAITDYNIDLLLSENVGCANAAKIPFNFDLEEPYESFKSVLVRSKDKVTIPGRSWKCIATKSFMNTSDLTSLHVTPLAIWGDGVFPGLTYTYGVNR